MFYGLHHFPKALHSLLLNAARNEVVKLPGGGRVIYHGGGDYLLLDVTIEQVWEAQ